MYRSLLAFTLAMLASGALALEAAPVDPQGVFDTQIAGIPVTPVDPFSFSANANGGGVFNFQNVSGNNWVGMDFFVTLPENTPIACGPGPFFVTCEVTSTPIGTTGMATYDIGFNQPRNGGILNSGIFSFNLNDPLSSGPNLNPNGSGGWGASTMINVAETDAVPEPASLWLLGGGIALLASVRRLRLRPQHKL